MHLCKEKHSWKSLISFPHILFSPRPLGIGLLETGEELIDYIGAHLKKLLSLQFACHINYKKSSPSPRYTNSLSMLVPTTTKRQNSSKLVSVLFLTCSFSLLFQSKEQLSRVRSTSSTHRLESAPGMTLGCPGKSFVLLFFFLYCPDLYLFAKHLIRFFC